MNVKISHKHDNVYYIRKNYMVKSFYDDENECINHMLSPDISCIFLSCGTIFLFIFTHAVWRNGKSPIHVFNQSHISSLKSGGVLMVNHFNTRTQGFQVSLGMI